MWPVLAAPGDAQWQFAATIGAGLLSLIALVVVAFIGLRGTIRATRTTERSEFDKTIMLDRQQLRDEVIRLTGALDSQRGELHRYRELYAALRVGVVAAGLDPDDLVRGHGDG